MTKAISLFLCIMAGYIAYGQTSFHYQEDFKKILARTKDQKDNLFYSKQLQRFSSNDTTLTDFEVLALLIGFTDKPGYKPYDDLSTEREVYKLNAEKKYKEGLDLGRKFIQTHPLSVKTLYEIAYSFHMLNLEDSVRPYVYRGEQIFKAMYFSGNGKTKDKPTFALGPADGQDYIYKFVGANIGTMGSGRDKQGNFLDILEAKFEDGTTVTLYFIIQHATDKMFGGKSAKEALEEQSKKKNK